MRAAALVTAAGSSQRFGGSMKKEYLPLGTGTVLSNAISPFSNPGIFTNLVVTIPEGGEMEAANALQDFPRAEEVIFVSGGASRQASVLAGLQALARYKPDVVLIHDGARPWCSQGIAEAVALRALEAGACAPAVPAVDAMKILSRDGFIIDNLSRETTYRIQTPQGFVFEDILEAHIKAAEDGGIYIDDTEIYGRYIGAVATVPGDETNRKITYQEDLKP
ncbi:IspD/TarI family cytidylyltransferase [Marispirochaeta sp.]|jgi:2-C-methyl-D-erythritol 4-phosphate cytidylyltransferase|uniref:IspD/TarI family cytidylyltransferase n=1 Tax=Marispirochaeta sp. TaxID=2038653 RepID=UPI0029C994C3|nr:IspD/TarI family cytidylyltransferase [Marispirochaeta sp.]